MPSQAPYFVTGQSAKIKNDGGSLFFGGNIAATRFVADPVGFLGVRSGFSEANPSIGMKVGFTALGLAAGTWQAMEKQKYVMLTFCTRLAGTNNTLLLSPGIGPNRGSQNLNVGSIRTTTYGAYYAYSTGGWYYQTGKPVSRGASQDTVGPEAYPGTRAIPGRIFWIAAGIGLNGTPNVNNYKVKTD